MTTSYLTLTTLLALTFCCKADSLNEQAAKLNQLPFPKVLRSVLDKEPRQLSYRLDKTTAISYDTWRCKLSAAWLDSNGNLIDLGSAVHDGRHGPQPRRVGKLVFNNQAAEFSSELGDVTFLGHSFLNDTLVIRFGIKDKAGKTIAIISETPSYSGGILKRSLTVSPASVGKDISFTPAAKATWMRADKKITTTKLNSPVAITTKLK